MLAPSALARRLTAPRKHSRPVLSEVCPLLYKTVENPVVWLSSSTFKLWNDRKQASGFANNSNTEFAEALLHGFMLSFMDESRSSQRKRARSQDSSAMYSPIPCTVSAYQFVLSIGYAFRKFYRCKCVLMNTRVFLSQVSGPCSFQHRGELALL